ncbi:TPA: hypothetical protein VB845_001123 [Streptococcus suis]|nr:hypothetical protein [Streptococcus suis]
MNTTAFNTMTEEILAQVEGGAVPYGWHAPFGYLSDNIICKNGYRYNTENMRKGNCAINWESVTNSIVASFVTHMSGAHSNRP